MFSTFNLTQFRFVFSKLCIHIPIKFDLIKINDWLRPERRPVVQAEDCHPQTKHLGPREGTLQGAENVIYLGFAAEKVGLYHVFPRKNREIPPISPISASGFHHISPVKLKVEIEKMVITGLSVVGLVVLNYIHHNNPKICWVII